MVPGHIVLFLHVVTNYFNNFVNAMPGNAARPIGYIKLFRLVVTSRLAWSRELTGSI